jgi:hypothetical protein
MTTPTARTLDKLRKEGWRPWVVEKWNHHTKTRLDLYNIGDVLAIRGSETLLVQATSYSNVSSRVKKIADSEYIAAIREAGWRVEVWGWHKVGRFWQARIVDCS